VTAVVGVMWMAAALKVETRAVQFVGAEATLLAKV